MKTILKIGKGIAIGCSVLALLYLSLFFTLLATQQAHYLVDLKWFAYGFFANPYFMTAIVVALVAALLFSIPPRRWWQWLILGLFVANVLTVAFLALYLPSPKPMTAQMMKQYYETHKEALQQLRSYIKLDNPDSLTLPPCLASYEIDEKGRFKYISARSDQFHEYDFFYHRYHDDYVCELYTDPDSYSTSDELEADTMLMVLGLDKGHLHQLMQQAGTRSFQIDQDQEGDILDIAFLVGQYSSTVSYWLDIYDQPISSDLEPGSIKINDSVAITCPVDDSEYYNITGNLLRIKPTFLMYYFECRRPFN